MDNEEPVDTGDVEGAEGDGTQMPFSLHRIDDVAAKMQIEGRYIEALEQMERALIMRSDMYGLDSEEVWENIKNIASICNSLAMQYVQHENFRVAHDLLKRAEELTVPREYNKMDKERLKIRAVTYNNLGCLYRRQNKLKAALKALEKAVDIESKTADVVNPAGTHLNICVILSQLGRHNLALEHAQAALLILQDELFAAEDEVRDRVDRMAILAIAFHNLAVEEEFLQRWKDCLQSYKKAVEVATTYLGDRHDISKQMKKSHKEAVKKITPRIKEAQKSGRGSRPSSRMR
eukprot:TRINITY_DN1650_c0_g1_i2.p1 TRINITY_DN1650_c0_g1~~TRINITY_DN1650_c0_g1_i2.p1  ORF type:complete len:291 (-),score=50.70 TRINITY_DN1650_c0_g1_i2:197-1069(-)